MVPKYWAVRVPGGDQNRLFWAAHDTGVLNAYNNAGKLTGGEYRTKQPGAVLAEIYANREYARVRLQPGQYHRRIWRPGAPKAPHYGDAWLGSAAALHLLTRRMREIFDVVEPAKQNWRTFGHEIRHLLILACCEVESGCKAVLSENGYRPVDRKGKPRRPDRGDYRKLVGPMRLDEWTVELTAHGGETFKPFAGWRRKGAKLPWYDAYNQVKHGREQEFRQATLHHAVTAVAAAYIMFLAQFGGTYPSRSRPVDDFFAGAKRRPRWPLAQSYPPAWLASRTAAQSFFKRFSADENPPTATTPVHLHLK